MKRLGLLILVLSLGKCTEATSKSNSSALAALVLGQGTVSASASTQRNPLREEMADTVVSAPANTGVEYRNSANAVNGVRGGGLNAGSLDVFSLDQTGSGASIVLSWKDKTIYNGTGIDFIVFENPFRAGSDPNSIFLEAIIVEVSEDNTNYCGFAPSYTHSSPTSFSRNPSHWQNFAGKTPVIYHDETNRLTGDSLWDTAQTGGDGFDLDNLSDSNAFNTGCSSTVKNSIQTNGFKYLKLTAASARTNPNTGSAFPVDSGAFDGPDIDGVLGRYRK